VGLAIFIRKTYLGKGKGLHMRTKYKFCIRCTSDVDR
jgi:hypothetical protein